MLLADLVTKESSVVLTEALCVVVLCELYKLKCDRNFKDLIFDMVRHIKL